MQKLSPTDQMLRMLNGHWLLTCIYIAAKRSLADIIEGAENHQASLTHIAQEAKIHPVWAYALLRALAKAEIFAETEPHIFKNTPLSDCLRSDHPHTVKSLASVVLSPRAFIQWSQLEYHLDNVEVSIPQRLWGKDFYQLFDIQSEDQPTRLSPENVVIELEQRSDFDQMLENLGTLTDPPIAQAYDFRGTVCDLGGSEGSLLTAICRHHPDVKGILFDRQIVIDHLLRQPLEYPFALVGGDFFQQVPYADMYILKTILHNWPDNQCVQILQQCAQANPNARVLVVEQLIGEPKNYAELLNLLMMLELNGKERTLEEYEEIGKSAGFKLAKVHATDAPQSILELVR